MKTTKPEKKVIKKFIQHSAGVMARAGLRYKTLDDFKTESMPTGPVTVKFSGFKVSMGKVDSIQMLAVGGKVIFKGNRKLHRGKNVLETKAGKVTIIN